jgi:hypothetical protein
MPTNGDLGRALERARMRVDLGRDELWAAYWYSGGGVKRSTFMCYLRGETEPTVGQYSIIGLALNERAREIGLGPLLPVLTVADMITTCCRPDGSHSRGCSQR